MVTMLFVLALALKQRRKKKSRTTCGTHSVSLSRWLFFYARLLWVTLFDFFFSVCTEKRGFGQWLNATRFRSSEVAIASLGTDTNPEHSPPGGPGPTAPLRKLDPDGDYTRLTTTTKKRNKPHCLTASTVRNKQIPIVPLVLLSLVHDVVPRCSFVLF